MTPAFNVCVFVCVCGHKVESETDASELRLSNTTGRLVQLEREVGLLRQNNREVDQLADRVERVTNEASQNAEEAQQVSADALCSLIHHFGKRLAGCLQSRKPICFSRFSTAQRSLTRR